MLCWENTRFYFTTYICKTKSPQQIMGSLVKAYYARKNHVKPNRIYHITLMPCYNKKLEASRSNFCNSQRDLKCGSGLLGLLSMHPIGTGNFHLRIAPPPLITYSWCTDSLLYQIHTPTMQLIPWTCIRILKRSVQAEPGHKMPTPQMRHNPRKLVQQDCSSISSSSFLHLKVSVGRSRE